MDIRKSIQKLAVRMTTAESIDQVQGQSIADAFGFLANNLNVNADGKLVVKEYKEPSQPSEGSGLLREPITINALENPEDANYLFLDYSIGFELGKSYNLNYTYKGVTKDITLVGYSQPQAGMGDEDNGIVIPQERMGQDFSFYTDDNGSSSDGSGSLCIMIMDKCQIAGEGIAYNENSAMIMFLANKENYELPFIINSITEA